MRDYLSEVRCVCLKMLARGMTPRVVTVAREIHATNGAVCRAMETLRESGVIQPRRNRRVAADPQTSAHDPRISPNLPEPKFHDLRMVFHRTRHELGGEGIPWRIKAKYVPVPQRAVNRRIEA